MPLYAEPMPAPTAKKHAPPAGARRPQPQHMGQQRGALWHTIQLKAAREAAAAPRARSQSGLPVTLKAGVEQLSGLAMDDVRVHRNSPEPARLGALAYAQGSDIHLGPGQERHLPHEAWHVVQQKQGRVPATAQLKGVALNGDTALEREADAMGRRAETAPLAEQLRLGRREVGRPVVQRQIDNVAPVEILNRNVAVSWKGGGDYAVTPTIINGKLIPPSSNKQGLILQPTYNLEDTGLQGNQALKMTVTVPVQSVGYRLELPTKGPWDLGKTVPVEEMDAFIRDAGIRTGPIDVADEKKPASLRIESDGDLEGQIRKHEMHHVHEQDDAVDEILVPWDHQFEIRKGPATHLRAFDPLTLFAKFDRLGDGKVLQGAQQVADALVARLEALGREYHETDEGKPPVVSRYAVAKGQNLWAYRIWLKLDKV
jgi:hypothetical protein